MERDTRHRRYLLTINNPEDSWKHEKIRATLDRLNLSYWCMADEVGLKEKTMHTHIYFVSKTSAIRFSTIKNIFPTAHIEPSLGSADCQPKRTPVPYSADSTRHN